MKTRHQQITEARARATAIRTAASESTGRKTRRPRQGRLIINLTAKDEFSPALIRARKTLVEIANRVADRYGYERLDDAMEGID
jgi:transposase